MATVSNENNEERNGGGDNNESSSSGNEMTAEWIVKAKLTISKPKKKAQSFNASDCGARRSKGSPCRVVYKWSSDGKDQAQQQNLTNTITEKSLKTRPQPTAQYDEIDSSDPHKNLKDMLKSTCNIVLTTDICPNAMIESNNNNAQNDRCTTHTYTFSPDQCQVFHEISQPRQMTEEGILVTRDVSCQTSDYEVKPIRKKSDNLKDENTNRSPNAEGRRKAYSGHRRATDSIVSSNSVQKAEGYRLTPSRSPRQSSPAFSNPSVVNSSKEKKKPPRTVHIDVYCTGSDADTNSSNSSSPNIVDDIANLMTQAQTVMDADDMVLKHRRVVTRGELPRKMMKDPKNTKIEITEPDDDLQPEQLFDFSQVLLQNNVNDKEEVNESKQMLFKKYLGDQRQIQKFNELRALMMRRQTSDDAISSNYPNSSYSTVRDLTSSSLASGVMDSPTIINFDDIEWKELDVAIQTGDFTTPIGNFQSWDKSDEYERMKDFRNLWREQPNDLLKQRQLMENFLFDPPLHRGDHSDKSGNISESDHSFNFQKSNELGNISDSSPSTVISYSHKKQKSDSLPNQIPKAKKEVKEVERKSVEPSTMSSSLKSGTYSKDHLNLAKRFGAVLKTLKKPGHHVGPVRNPSCMCETCKRWVLDRDQVQGRERAYSFGETPITQTTFWKRNNRYYV
ncbi:uncharacterized protein [Chironomus tepperi]|uniref:uncharacterized protein n=1 Tax=Chironomus tepperi TaxID=113505 RepID=UPI00391F8B2E